MEEEVAGEGFVGEVFGLGAGGVDEQADGEREIAVVIEVADGDRMAVFAEGEGIFVEIGDEVAVGVAHDGVERDKAGGDGEGGGLRRLGILRRKWEGEAQG